MRLSVLAFASLLAASPGVLGVTVAAAADNPDAGWTQFRGPHRDGTATAAGLATAWPAGGPPEVWRQRLGSGFAGVIYDGSRVYTAVASGEEEAVVALDARTGASTWRTVVGVPMRSEFGDGPRATPTLVDGRLYFASSQSRLVALDAASGKLLWDRDLAKFEPMPRFGYAISPLVVDGLVIVDIGTKDLVDAATAEVAAKAAAEAKAAGKPAPEPPPPADPSAPPPPPSFPPPVGSIAAFDAKTGELRWRGGFAGPAGYSSPVLAEIAGVRQLVYSRGSHVSAIGLDGKLLWRHETPPRTVIASPLVMPGDVVFVSSADDGHGGLAVAVRRDAAGAWTTSEVWSQRLLRNHFNMSLRVGDAIYGFDNGTFRCLDAKSGELKWAQRGFGKGSLVAAGDLLFVLADDGTLALVRANPAAYEELGRVQAMTGKAWTSPALAGGTLYLRDHDEIVAYDVRATSVAAASAPAASAPSTAAPASAADLAAAEALSVEQILDRYAAARGGRERWHAVKTLELAGTYKAFSEQSPFTFVRQRRDDGDLYRLDYALPTGAAVRACDGGGPWLQHPFLSEEPLRVRDVKEMAAYEPQMLREGWFEPLLLDPARRGATVAKAGHSEINGRPTLDLRVTLAQRPGEEKPAEEIWHLDPRTFLEVAVDSRIVDYTQGEQPFLQRSFYGDFRTVDGLVLPFRVDSEFNARYEAMTVASARVDGEIDPGRFAPPPPKPADPDAAAKPNG